MEQAARGQEQIELPINYYWNISDPMLPFVSSAPGNPFMFPPSNATREAPPPSYPKGTYPCWNPDIQNWSLLPDFRQVRLWDKSTGQEVFSGTINCPSTAIDVPPPSEYCTWSDETSEWVKDQERENASIVAQRQKKKASELTVASSQIAQIDEIVIVLEEDDPDSAEPYSALLKEWKTYRAKLNLFKPEKLETDFPKRPKTLEEM